MGEVYMKVGDGSNFSKRAIRGDKSFFEGQNWYGSNCIKILRMIREDLEGEG